MIKAEGAAGMPDKEVWALIFEPGFSTADKVTEVSGRGVGMDVVKKNLERIRGKADIRTSAGRGNRVRPQDPADDGDHRGHHGPRGEQLLLDPAGRHPRVLQGRSLPADDSGARRDGGRPPRLGDAFRQARRGLQHSGRDPRPDPGHHHRRPLRQAATPASSSTRSSATSR